MAILTRKTQFVFASAAADIGQFGSGQLGTKVTTTDPAVVMNASGGAAWAGGWLDAVLGANKFPPLEEMNGIAFVNTYQLAYLFQEGIPEYDAGTNYSQFAIVKKAGTFQLYGSLITNNLGNALTVGADWQLLVDLSVATLKSAVPQTFSGAGAHTYTRTANTVFSIIELCGTAGGSAGLSTTGAVGGGGGAGYLKAQLTAAQIGATQTITLGAGGIAGTTGPTDGGNGGASSVGSLVSITGGQGSLNATTLGGTGGVPTVTTGTPILLVTGQTGSPGWTANAGFGGGAGGNPAGGFGHGGPSTSINNGGAGVPGTGFGGGAGGPCANGGSAAGAAGGGAYCIITDWTH